MENNLNLTKLSSRLKGDPYIIRNIKKINYNNKLLYDFYCSNGDIIKANIILNKIKNNKDILLKLV